MRRSLPVKFNCAKVQKQENTQNIPEGRAIQSAWSRALDSKETVAGDGGEKSRLNPSARDLECTTRGLELQPKGAARSVRSLKRVRDREGFSLPQRC